MTHDQMAHVRSTPLSKVDKLRQDAADAAGVRAFQTHPDVVALRVESVRSQVDTLMWVGIVLGLAFTMVNVQTFAAGSAAPFTLAWFAAWLLDPMVSLVLIAVLRAEQVTARYQVATGLWVRRTKVFAFAATYVMNTWASWQVLNPAGIVLHSVPPVLVYCAAEAGPTVRDRLTEAVLRAARMAATAPGGAVHEPTSAATPAPFAEPSVNGQPAAFMNPVTGGPLNGAVTESVNGADTPTRPVRERRAPARRTSKPAGKTAGRRKLRADYVADARAAWTPGIDVTPAWVRQVTDCSRGMSSQVAADLNAAPDQQHSDPIDPTPHTDTEVGDTDTESVELTESEAA